MTAATAQRVLLFVACLGGAMATTGHIAHIRRLRVPVQPWRAALDAALVVAYLFIALIMALALSPLWHPNAREIRALIGWLLPFLVFWPAMRGWLNVRKAVAGKATTHEDP